jgi:hypothetical protein
MGVGRHLAGSTSPLQTCHTYIHTYVTGILLSCATYPDLLQSVVECALLVCHLSQEHRSCMYVCMYVCMWGFICGQVQLHSWFSLEVARYSMYVCMSTLGLYLLIGKPDLLRTRPVVAVCQRWTMYAISDEIERFEMYVCMHLRLLVYCTYESIY